MMKKLLLTFILLQIADFATTVLVLAMGGTEQNPLVLRLMGTGTLSGLVIAKLIVLGAGVAIALAGRPKVVRLACYAFALIVLWNLSVIGRLYLITG